MADDEKPFHNPFGALAHLRGDAPATPWPEAKASGLRETAAHPVAGVRPIARAVVRIERAGRGGKEVTVVEHLDLSAQLLEKMLKDLKSSLGCGGVVENGAIVLQGDHRKRLPDILEKRGVKKVVLG
jgi:translation initiation factor 1